MAVETQMKELANIPMMNNSETISETYEGERL